MTLQSRYTYTLLAVSKATFEDVKSRLMKADQERDLRNEEEVDMHGLALTVDWGEEAMKTAETPVKTSNRKPRRQLKSELWAAAVTRGQNALANIEAAIEKMRPDFEALEAAFEELQNHKDDYAERLGNIPENLQNGEFAEKLRAIDELDGLDYDGDTLNEMTDKMSELSSTLDECEAADLPKD